MVAEPDDIERESAADAHDLTPGPHTPGRAGITAAPMPAHRDDWERQLLADPKLLRDMAIAAAGPFHVVYPARVGQNIRAFREVFDRAGVVGAIYYGKKANKAACVVTECATHGVGVDVSSAAEFDAALRGGVDGGDLMVTGPAKSDELLRLSVWHRAIIAIDSLEELERLSQLSARRVRSEQGTTGPEREISPGPSSFRRAFGRNPPSASSGSRPKARRDDGDGRRHHAENLSNSSQDTSNGPATPGEPGGRAAADRRPRVVLRVLPPGSHSRFGLTEEQLDLAVTRIEPESMLLEGFSFHLTGYDYAPRAELAAALIDRCREARGLGHPVTTISIGGGFGVDYVPEQAWRNFVAGVNPRWFHGDKRPSPDSFYPYHFPDPGPTMLARVLEHDDLAGRLRREGLRLAVEPGRALLDRAGSSVFRVQGVKELSAHGHSYSVLTVDGTSLSLSEQWFDSEFLPDPVLWPERSGAVTPTCVGGASCLEDDMLSWRRIPLPGQASTGDLLIYPNTAGYQMDSNESAFHELPIPPKVVLRDRADGMGFTWTVDSPDPRVTSRIGQAIADER